MTELDEIRAQLGRLSDRASIQDLVNRYAMAVDDHDLETVAGMYTADACFSRRGRVSTGRDAVLRSLEKSMRRYGPTIHTPHTLVITWDDADHAHGVATGHAEPGRMSAGRCAAGQWPAKWKACRPRRRRTSWPARRCFSFPTPV